MLGIEDKYVSAAYLACIGSVILCVLYGLIFWNRDGGETKQEDIQWAVDEKKVEDES